MTAEERVLERMRRNPVSLRVSEIAQGARLSEEETRLALVELCARGKVEPAYWRLTVKDPA